MSKFTCALVTLLAAGVTLQAQASGYFESKPNKTTVCTITVNSPNEKDAFRRGLPKDKFQFVELVERGRRDWLASACQQQVQCDVLIISGHFGGTLSEATGFYSDQVTVNESLPVEEMERVACSESCPGLFSKLKEVYLFGCETLNGEATKNTSAEIARTLVQAGHSAAEADRVSRALNERHAETNRDRMRRIFASVPVIYGFPHIAPLGPIASSSIGHYFQTGSGGEIASGHVSQRMLGAFSANGMTVTSGLGDSDRQNTYRREVCQFFDDRLSAAQQLAFIHQLLGRDMAEVRMFFERIEAFFGSLKDDERQTPAFASTLADITSDKAARERYLVFARKSASPPIRARMIEVAHTLGWLSKDEKRAELVRMIEELLADGAMGLPDLDLICALNRNGELDRDFERLQIASGQFYRTRYAAGLACLGNTQGRARVLQALASPLEDDVQVAQIYLRHRPITDPTELRIVATAVTRMPRSPAQVQALDALARQHVSDRESLSELARLFPVAGSVSVQRAIAGIFIRSDYQAFDKTELVRVLRQSRLKSPDGEDVIDVLIRRLQASS